MEVTLQVIVEKLRALIAGQSALKSEISTTSAELKGDNTTGQVVVYECHRGHYRR